MVTSYTLTSRKPLSGRSVTKGRAGTEVKRPALCFRYCLLICVRKKISCLIIAVFFLVTISLLKLMSLQAVEELPPLYYNGMVTTGPGNFRRDSLQDRVANARLWTADAFGKTKELSINATDETNVKREVLRIPKDGNLTMSQKTNDSQNGVLNEHLSNASVKIALRTPEGKKKTTTTTPKKMFILPEESEDEMDYDALLMQYDNDDYDEDMLRYGMPNGRGGPGGPDMRRFLREMGMGRGGVMRGGMGRADMHDMLMRRQMGPGWGEGMEAGEGEAANSINEVRHVFFLKVHKAASTTVMNTLYRFALKRRLAVMVPRRGNLLSESGRSWIRSALPVPMGHDHFDILCNHLIFNERAVRASVPRDARYIAIVREPFQQFLSAFRYYRTRFRVGYLMRIGGADPVETYLQDPRKYEARHAQGSYTRSRMSVDFGFDTNKLEDEAYIQSYVRYLNNTFHLVMVSDRFDESMVLLKRLLGWRLEDILYVKNNVFNKQKKEYSQELWDRHRAFNPADYALYDHFSSLFQKKVEAEGKLFAEEVLVFVSLRESVEQFCNERGSGQTLSLDPTKWTAAFTVYRQDCMFMSMPEVPFVNLVRARQYPGFGMFRGRHWMDGRGRRVRGPFG